jgi:hypothetical protein
MPAAMPNRKTYRKQRILEDSDDGLVEVGEDDPGVPLRLPTAARSSRLWYLATRLTLRRQPMRS